jgi:hypothetical protein
MLGPSRRLRTVHAARVVWGLTKIKNVPLQLHCSYFP